MKKIIMVFAIVGACTTLAVAQDSSATSTTPAPSAKAGSHQMKDCVMMKDGKVMVMKGGAVTALYGDLTLTNGTTVKSDGTVKASDGTTMKLMEGEKIDMDGKMLKMDTNSTTPPQK
jgi:regulator of RNase E activity RraA